MADTCTYRNTKHGMERANFMTRVKKIITFTCLLSVSGPDFLFCEITFLLPVNN